MHSVRCALTSSCRLTTAVRRAARCCVFASVGEESEEVSVGADGDGSGLENVCGVLESGDL